MNNPKVVATIGPSSNKPEVFEKIAENIAIARMNFSHGTHESHQETIEYIQQNFPKIEILTDLQGPKIRLGKFPNGSAKYKALEITKLIYNLEKINECDKEHLYVNQSAIITDINIGDYISFNDGYLKAKVIEKEENELTIQVLNHGELSSNKGINSSTASLSVEPLTEKDLNDLDFISTLNQDPDYVALSFVREAQDVVNLRKILKEKNINAKIIVKLERHEAMQNLKEIIIETDLVMIARGDLGVEIDIKDLPYYQQEIIRISKEYNKPTIRATQVLESMRYAPIPTRAEITDLYTAITSGSDYTMLSAESATGDYTYEAVSLMADMWKKYSNID